MVRLLVLVIFIVRTNVKFYTWVCTRGAVQTPSGVAGLVSVLTSPSLCCRRVYQQPQRELCRRWKRWTFHRKSKTSNCQTCPPLATSSSSHLSFISIITSSASSSLGDGVRGWGGWCEDTRLRMGKLQVWSLMLRLYFLNPLPPSPSTFSLNVVEWVSSPSQGKIHI